MTETRYAVVESKDGNATVEATFDNRPHAKAAAREFCQEVAAHQDAELENMVVKKDRITFEDHGYVALVTEVTAYDAGETL